MKSTRAQRIEKLAIYLAWNQAPVRYGRDSVAHWRAKSGTQREYWTDIATERIAEMRRAGLVVRRRGER